MNRANGLRTAAVGIGAAALLAVAVLAPVSAQVTTYTAPTDPGRTLVGASGPTDTMANPGGSELRTGAGQLTAAPTNTRLPATGVIQTPTTPPPPLLTTPTTLPRVPTTPTTPTRTPTATATPTAPLPAVTGPTTVEQSDLPLTATLIGAAEVPGPGDEDGLGSAAVTFHLAQGLVCYAVHVVNIEPATAAHIHRGDVTESGPVVVPFDPPSGGNASGCAQGIDRDLIAELMQNPQGFYVNVHNAVFPEGAVRGQLGR